MIFISHAGFKICPMCNELLVCHDIMLDANKTVVNETKMAFSNSFTKERVAEIEVGMANLPGLEDFIREKGTRYAYKGRLVLAEKVKFKIKGFWSS